MADDVPGDSPEPPTKAVPSNDTTAHFTDDFVSQLAAMEAGISPEE